jgi:hypothetical protein
MKTKTLIITILLSFSYFYSFTQSPEQQKAIDDLYRIQDSILNTPEAKAAMQQIKEMREKYDREKEKTAPNKNKVVEKPKTDNTKYIYDKYWKNTMESNNNKFENWNGGSADITIAYGMKPGEQKLRMLKLGSINTDGSIVFNLPENVETRSPINSFVKSLRFLDLYGTSSESYTNGDTGFLSDKSLFISRNEQLIGLLTIGNSVKVTLNLVDQSSLYLGDEGYLLYWAYVQGDSSLNVNENWKGKVRADDTNTIEVETNVNYNLNFKKGWNLVKAEVIGNYKFKNQDGIDLSYFKTHKHTVISSMPADAKYYFRTYEYLNY